jgi:hypothetical protein
MTEQEHDSLYPLSRIMIADNYIKVDTLLKRLGSMYPDDPYARIGTVPERLAHLLGRLTGDPTMFADMVYSIETPNADDVACAETPYPYHLVSCRQGRTELVPMDTPMSRCSDTCNQEMLNLLALAGTIPPPPMESDHELDCLSGGPLVSYYWGDINPPEHTPMAYEHTEALGFFDPINEVGLVGHMPIGTRIGFATRYFKIGHTPIGTIVEDSTNE